MLRKYVPYVCSCVCICARLKYPNWSWTSAAAAAAAVTGTRSDGGPAALNRARLKIVPALARVSVNGGTSSCGCALGRTDEPTVDPRGRLQRIRWLRRICWRTATLTSCLRSKNWPNSFRLITWVRTVLCLILIFCARLVSWRYCCGTLIVTIRKLFQKMFIILELKTAFREKINVIFSWKKTHRHFDFLIIIRECILFNRTDFCYSSNE